MFISNQTQIMEICDKPLTQVKRNVAKKSTSNRPLKNISITKEVFNCSGSVVNEKIHFTKTYSRINPMGHVNPISAEKAHSHISLSAKEPLLNIQSKCHSPKTLNDDRIPRLFHEESEEEDEEIEGIFSISDSLLPFLSESNLSPSYSQDSSDESIESYEILNYPVKFPSANYKDVPFYSNKLLPDYRSYLDNSYCDKNEKINCDDVSTKVFDETKNALECNDTPLSCNTITNDNDVSFDPSFKNNKSCEVFPEKEIVAGKTGEIIKHVREEVVICEDKHFSMTVIETEYKEDKQVAHLINTDETMYYEDEDNDADVSALPIIVSAISLEDGDFNFDEDEATLQVEGNKNMVSKKSKIKKRKTSSKVYFGARKKRTRSSCKSNLSVDLEPNTTMDIYSSQESVSNLESSNIFEKESIQEVNSEGFNADKPTINSDVATELKETISLETKLLDKNLSIADNNKSNEAAGKDEKSSHSSESSKFISEVNDNEVIKDNQNEHKKKSKKEINEGVLLHVEAAKKTNIMRDGKILKDKKELLKDIESKIEKNLPVEVKDFDIQQSLTEEILLEQALRLAHQRTSPRRRPVLSKSETKAILKCLSDQPRYKTRRLDKKPIISDNELSSSEDKLQSEVDVFDTNNSNSSLVDNPDLKTDVTEESGDYHVSEKTDNSDHLNKLKQQKKKKNKRMNKSTKKSKSQPNYLTTEKLDLNALSKTFGNVLQDIHSSNSTDENILSGNEEKKQGLKSTCRKKKTNKKSKKNSLKDGEFFHIDNNGATDHPYNIPEKSLRNKEYLDESSAENDGFQDRRVPVIIIKNKKVTLTDRRKNSRITNKLFTIIKPRESNVNNNYQLQSQESKSEILSTTKLLDSGTEIDINGKNIVLCEETSKEMDTQKCSEVEKPLNEITVSENINTCASENNGVTDNKSLQHSNDDNNKLLEPLNDKKREAEHDSFCNYQNIKLNPSPTISQVENINKQTSYEVPVLKSDVNIIPKCSNIQLPNSDDIVEVVDMEIVDVDSPKPNSASTKICEENIIPQEESNSSSIPFLDGTDASIISNKDTYSDESVLAIINNAEEKPAITVSSSKPEIGFPIPTIAEMKNRYAPTLLAGISRSGFTLPTSFSDSAESSVPSMTMNINTGFSSSSASLSSASASDKPSLSVDTLPGFTSVVAQGSIPSASASFYSPYSPALSNPPHFISSTTPQNTPLLSSSYQLPMSSTVVTTLTTNQMFTGMPLQSTLHSTKDVPVYPPPPTPGLTTTCRLPPVPSPIDQNTNLSASETTASSIQSPHLSMNSTFSFPNYLYPSPEKNQDLVPSFPYPPQTLEVPNTDNENNAIPTKVVKEANDIRTEKPTCEVNSLEQPQNLNPNPPPEQLKSTKVPYSIFTRDPRLRTKRVCVIFDKQNFAVTPTDERHNSTGNLGSQTFPEKTKEKLGNEESTVVQSIGINNEIHEELENNVEMNIETEYDGANSNAKKKPRKKEIDQELLYKTPLSDLHDAPERTSSYSRTLPGRHLRLDKKRDPRSFRRRDGNDEGSPDHHEHYRERLNREYSQPEEFNYDSRMVPESYPSDIRVPDPHRLESYEPRNEEYITDMRRQDHYSKRRQEEFSHEKRSRDYPERRPLCEHPSQFRRPNYRQRENYPDSHSRSHEFCPDFRRPSGPDFRRKNSNEDLLYPRWDYAHKRIEGIFPPEVPECEKSYSTKSSEGYKDRWEDENEIRDLIEGPVPSASRPFYRRKRFSKSWKPSHLRDDEGSSSPYSEDLFERRRDGEMMDINERTRERPWSRKCDELINGPDRDVWEDRRYYRSSRDSRDGRSRSPKRDYEMYEKKRSRSPRRERNRVPGRESLSPRESPLESPMSPEPEVITYVEPPKYLSIPQ